MNEKATQNSWKTIPMEKPQPYCTHLTLTPEHFAKLQMGFIPENMDDRWFVYFDNDWVYLHRSWTGYETFRAKIQTENDCYTIKEFWAETEQGKFNVGSENKNIELFCFVIARVVLKVEVAEIQANI